MAKVGRAAYAASRARLEVVTADKSISVNESGELYAVDCGSDGVAITLPSNPQGGTRYKFMVIDDVDTGTITITTGNTGTQPFQGGILHVDSADTTDGVTKADGGSSGADAWTLAADTLQGSHVTCVYDSENSRWLVEGMIYGPTAAAIA